MRNILVVGGAGFAGSGLVKKFLDRGYKVSVIDFVSPPMQYNLFGYLRHPNLKQVWKAMKDVDVTDLEGYDTIIHLAAQADVPMGMTSPEWTTELNVAQTRHLLEQMIRLKKYPDRIIYAGSGNEFGRPVYLPIDENHPLTPHNPYSSTKAQAEMDYWSYMRYADLPVTIMSNGACLGAGMRRDIFIFKWLSNMILGLPVRLEGGDQTRDLTYVTDILDAWDLVVEADPAVIRNQKFQVSYGHEEKVSDILKMCYDVTGSTVPTIQTDYRRGEKGQREWFTNEKARKVLGYAPKVGPLEGIKLTYEWMKTLDTREL